jgi:RNA polymerase sigma-70 factor (ECF subfamily)
MPGFAFAALGSSDHAKLVVSERGLISDTQLLALARESQREALDALYAAYKSRIYTFLLRFLADPELADDVTQEAFTKAFNALPKLERGTKVLPWLYKVASNTAIDHMRRTTRFTWVRMGAIQDTSHEPHAADESGAVGEREHVQSVLRMLPPENAVALLLHALEGYSYKEIAEIQGASLTAVRSRIARARNAFKEGYATKDPA